MEKINPQQVDELREWVRTEAKGLGDTQAALLLSMLDMVGILLRDKTTQKKALETLRQLMGILPKSERGISDKQLGRKNLAFRVHNAKQFQISPVQERARRL